MSSFNLASLPECLYCNGYLHDNDGALISCIDCPRTKFQKERSIK